MLCQTYVRRTYPTENRHDAIIKWRILYWRKKYWENLPVFFLIGHVRDDFLRPYNVHKDISSVKTIQ